MMSPLWLFLIIPISVFFGFCACGILSSGKHADQCLECQYNCKNCKLSKEKSE